MITLDEFKKDFNWRCAFYEAVNHEYSWDCDVSPHPIDNVTEVHYESYGKNEGPDWVAVVSWSGEEGPFAVMSAGCDYTGWD